MTIPDTRARARISFPWAGIPGDASSGKSWRKDDSWNEMKTTCEDLVGDYCTAGLTCVARSEEECSAMNETRAEEDSDIPAVAKEA